MAEMAEMVDYKSLIESDRFLAQLMQDPQPRRVTQTLVDFEQLHKFLCGHIPTTAY
jgi:hypothetical protein